MIRSGPAPTLAATAALGRISSQLSVSSRTLMPVCATNFRVSSAKLSYSDLMNCFQRSTLICAPASGSLLHSAAACALLPAIGLPTVATAAPAATPALMTSRRVILLMASSVMDGVGDDGPHIWAAWRAAGRLGQVLGISDLSPCRCPIRIPELALHDLS